MEKKAVSPTKNIVEIKTIIKAKLQYFLRGRYQGINQ
jgi:hypothetical protein